MMDFFAIVFDLHYLCAFQDLTLLSIVGAKRLNYRH